MPDIVRPLRAAERKNVHHITSMNGVGRTLLAPTATDASGAYFRTMWFMLIGPVFPIARYYVRPAEPNPLTGVYPIGSQLHYDILGRSPLVPAEVLRTYLYFWLLAPLVVGGPLVPLMQNIDGVWRTMGVWAFLLVIGVLIGSTCVLVYGTRLARQRWYKPRTVRWQ